MAIDTSPVRLTFGGVAVIFLLVITVSVLHTIDRKAEQALQMNAEGSRFGEQYSAFDQVAGRVSKAVEAPDVPALESTNERIELVEGGE